MGMEILFVNGGIRWKPLSIRRLSFCTYIKDFKAEIKGQKILCGQFIL